MCTPLLQKTSNPVQALVAKVRRAVAEAKNVARYLASFIPRTNETCMVWDALLEDCPRDLRPMPVHLVHSGCQDSRPDALWWTPCHQPCKLVGAWSP